VAPGAYDVTVKYADHEAKGTVRVLADPRAKNTEADWRKREEAVSRLTALNDALAEAVDRIRKTRSDIDQVLAKAQAAKSEKDKQEAAAADASSSTDDKAGKKDDKPDPLAEAGGKLKGDLDKMERRLWVPYDTVGLQPETDVLTKVFYAMGYVLSTYEPPSPTHLEYLRQAEVAVQSVLADFNHLFETDVAAFRKQVDESKIRLLPEMGPVEVKKP
jgi:Sec-independent protein translocase protein TatA